MTEELTKDTLRTEAIRHRDRIDPSDPSECIEKACELFMKTFKPEPDMIIALYYPKGREFSTAALMDELQKAGVTCALPVVKPDSRLLEFYSWADGEALTENKYGIAEPVADGKQAVTPDIIVTPFLAFDRKGRRLGYGGGYYDATLSFLRAGEKPPLAVGLGYAKQAVIFNLPYEAHDEIMDWVITPQKAHYFGD